jgi:general secretion pathway protein G
MTKRIQHHRAEEGFTLLELLIVVAIVGIVAAIAMPSMQYALDKSKQRVTMTDLRTVGGALTQYYLDQSYYPDGSLTAQQLVPILRVYSGDVPYEDRWGNEFGYSANAGSYYSVESFGHDGIDGTDIDYLTRNDFNLDLIHARGSFAASPDL